MRLRERTWNSGNCRSHASSIAWILSLGCLEIGDTRSRFSSTNSLTNICSRSKMYTSQPTSQWCYSSPWKKNLEHRPKHFLLRKQLAECLQQQFHRFRPLLFDTGRSLAQCSTVQYAHWQTQPRTLQVSIIGTFTLLQATLTSSSAMAERPREAWRLFD